MGVVTPLVSTGQARLFLSLSGHKCSQERLPLYILKVRVGVQYFGKYGQNFKLTERISYLFDKVLTVFAKVVM